MLILVVDDEPQIRKLLSVGLSSYGYDVVTAANAFEALNIAATRAPAAVVLDIALGEGPDGLSVCRRLREWSTVPVIMLSVQADETTKVTALDAGADDYLTKPFSMQELRARLQAVLRRSAQQQNEGHSATITVGDLLIDFAARRVFTAGKEIHLTPIEYDILRLLATNAGKVLTHEMILARVWGAGYHSMTHYVRVYVNQLRRKLGEDPSTNKRYILNEPGVGYRFIDLLPT